MGRTAIEFQQVSKQYPNSPQYAVKEVSVSIEEGSFVTILGTSGSGKTTFLKMVNRLYEPTAGRILFFGESIQNLNAEEYRRKIGYVIQQIGLFPHMTIEDNIATIPNVLNWDKQKIAGRVEELLELVGLSPQEYRKRYPRQLSGGQQQRVGLARAMAADPAIMLMDEPFGAIDAITRQTLQEELLHIQKKLHKTILFVTHDIGEAFKLGDQVIIMHNGEIQQFATPCQIMLQPANDYVARLVATEDTLQHLKVLTAASVMSAADSPHTGAGRVKSDASLYSVLTFLLESPQEYVLVEDDLGHIVGKITWDELKLKNKRHTPVSA
ncbi:Glycine betaine/carnitine/choline transport ATP-binding protein OpuCA [Propionispora sp. 2/2-37]|uniref:ABC transporter ATP-binding protein n=1 Tax=Propionispora sp. 2/2-37 TaxID=1677858 RepID=UPI0006BB5418|nr:ABC transporter ATP-binding protein [Propionispora sp. 2/2-37]CUH95976.1 Glycine betaine/carnitine/choline transport ATP-binding protein OpuCA [Propionispora sp. 2/2-37]